MKTTTTMIQLLGALGLLAGGCVANESGSHGSSGSLEACADTVREGGPCDFTTEVRCTEGMADVVCRCARSADGGGRIVCERPGPTDPGDPGSRFCSDHVRSGEACDAAADVECRHACDPAILCRCAPSPDGTEPGSTTDPAAARRVWVCGVPVPPPGSTDTCTDWHVEACRDPMRDPAVSCVRGGAICRCGVSSAGEIGLVCEIPPPPPPGGRECTDELIASCAGSTGGRDPSSTDDGILCYRDGRACRCAPATAAGERATVVCEDPAVPPVPGPTTCTEELLRICAAGMAAECISSDGRHCWCDPRSAGAMGFVCDVPPPPPPGGTGTCTDADIVRCAAGERIECSAPDGRICRCDATTADGRLTIVCEPAPPPPPPPGTGAVCTDADYARCAAGERVECASRDGTVCRCASTTADMRPTLICG